MRMEVLLFVMLRSSTWSVRRGRSEPEFVSRRYGMLLTSCASGRPISN